LTCMRRPGTHDSHGARPSNISSESRVRNRISPIQTKSGSAAIVQLALEPQNAWKRLASGGLVVKICRPAHATAASEIAIHTPQTRSASRSASRTAATVSVVMELETSWSQRTGEKMKSLQKTRHEDTKTRSHEENLSKRS